MDSDSGNILRGLRFAIQQYVVAWIGIVCVYGIFYVTTYGFPVR
jgi:hypothetical protein